MLNLLHGEFYKLHKSKCLYICCISIAVFVFFLYGTFYLANTIQQGDLESGSYGLHVSATGAEETADYSIWDDVGILNVTQTMFGSFGSIITAIFSCIFVLGEYANGAIKNITGKGYKRWKVFTAKYISTTAAVILQQLVMLAAILIAETCFVGTKRFDSAFWVNFINYSGIQILLGAALTGMVVMIGQLCRNLGAGIAISICMVVFSSFVTSGLNGVFAYFKWNVKASDYWILDLISSCPLTDLSDSFAVHAVVLSIVWFVIALAMGIWHFKRADVK